ncbi:hypothetical protein ACHAW6_004630 [Cyclotella cf. meneghiniana]
MQGSLSMNCWNNVSTQMDTIKANSYPGYGNTTGDPFGSDWGEHTLHQKSVLESCYLLSTDWPATDTSASLLTRTMRTAKFTSQYLAMLLKSSNNST